MKHSSEELEAEALAAAIEADFQALPVRNTLTMRAIRRKYSRMIQDKPAGLIFHLARRLCKKNEYRWIGYELIQGHREAFKLVGEAELEELGQGINSWWTVDAFARTLVGPTWLKGQVSDELIAKWAKSSDLWWRRAALVSTVALNIRSQGGHGDVPRTLGICHLLAGDHVDMVAKALSWALRELAVHDAEAVVGFIKENDQVLAMLVKREVRNKLRTGLKNPRGKGS